MHASGHRFAQAACIFRCAPCTHGFDPVLQRSIHGHARNHRQSSGPRAATRVSPPVHDTPPTLKPSCSWCVRLDCRPCGKLRPSCRTPAFGPPNYLFVHRSPLPSDYRATGRPVPDSGRPLPDCPPPRFGPPGSPILALPEPLTALWWFRESSRYLKPSGPHPNIPSRG